MPTLNYSFRDLSSLIKKKISREQLEESLKFAKAELERFSGDEILVKFNDTNQPHLWTVEGLAIFLQGILGVELGIPVVKTSSKHCEVRVEKSVRGIRQFISAFKVENIVVTEEFLVQLIQSQEKICDVYGRRREKIAVGIYPSRKISFPVTFKAVQPKSVRFTPLGMFEDLNLQEILENHPKGLEYGKILSGFKKYPLLVDSSRNILSFPPIINSSDLGAVEPGTDELFFEVTGTDQQLVNVVSSIFAHSFSKRGGVIVPGKIFFEGKKIIAPKISPSFFKLPEDVIERVLGRSFSEKEKRDAFRMLRMDYSAGKVLLPSYRADVMHPVDLVEDLAISAGYDNIKPLPLTTYTVGGTSPLIPLINSLRLLSVGAGFQETFSQILSSEEVMSDRMGCPDFGSVKVKNYSSANYSMLRTWIIPQLLEILSKNKHNVYPQKLFEEGVVVVRNGNDVKEYERIAFASSHTNVDFTELKQVVDFIFRGIGVFPVYEECEHKSFIQGRVASISVNGSKIAFIGEIHPQVLSSFGLELPVVAAELNITLLSESMKNYGAGAKQLIS